MYKRQAVGLWHWRCSGACCLALHPVGCGHHHHQHFACDLCWLRAVCPADGAFVLLQARENGSQGFSGGGYQIYRCDADEEKTAQHPGSEAPSDGLCQSGTKQKKDGAGGGVFGTVGDLSLIHIFAEKTDGNEADRTAEGFAKMFGSYFPPEFSITEGNAWMSTLNNSVQYVSVIRPGEKVAKLVKRMHYVSFVGMFRSDLFEGLCVGHAPKKCKICGKWFLTTNARHTKYLSLIHI